MIAICTPARDTIQAGTAFDLIQLIKYSPDTLFTISQGTLLPNQSTELVRRSIEAHVSHVLFIDSDMRFPPNTLEILLSHQKMIIGANCKHRQANKWTANISSKDKQGIVEVKSLGFGVTLIRTDIFFRIAQPWFGTPFDGDKFIGEDIFFCHKLKDIGIPIFIDHDLSQRVKHIGSIEL